MIRLSSVAIIVAIFLCLQVFGQHKNPVSFNKSDVADKIVYSFTNKDTAEILQLYRKGNLYQYSKPDTAMRFFEKALSLSQQKGFYDGAAVSLIGMGFTETGVGHHDKAMANFQKAKAYCQMAIYNKSLLSTWNVNIGIWNIYQGKYDVAAAYFNHALIEAKLANLQEDGPNYLSIYNNMSAVYVRMKQPATALRYLNMAERISRKSNKFRELAFTLCNSGDAYMDLNKYEEAYRSFTEGLSICEKYGLTEIARAIKNDMGELMLRQNKPAEAIKYLKTSTHPNYECSPLYNTILPGYNLGKAYFQLKKFKEAEQCLIETIRNADSIGFTDGKLEAYQTLSKVYAAQHKYDLALIQQEQYSALKDSILTKEKVKDINEMEIKYHTAEKDKDLVKNQLLISQQQIRIQQKNNWIFASAASLLLLTLILILIYRYNKSKQHILAGRISMMEQDQKIKLLLASVEGEEQERIRIGRELHDGIGGLLSAAKLQMASISLRNQTGADEDFSKAVMMLDEANTEIRKTAHNLMPEILLKYGIGEAIDNFCRRISSDQTPLFFVQIYGDIPRMEPHFELSVYRIVQELVNNILKHAAATEAIVQLNWQENILHISVEDNGRGMDLGQNQGGIGLKNITDRVKAMNGQMETESCVGVGTTIYIDFFRSVEANIVNLNPS